MRQLPKGTVTFVFTDIEGSTRLLHTLGDRYRQALEQHRAILRDAFTSHGGIEVDTQGDAFFFAFPTPRAALQAAVGGQRDLAHHLWPNEAELRVRMGIHTGTPEVTAEGYVGSDVHLGARICAVAWGGQILVSPTTAAHVATSDDTSLRPLGAHALKDIDERMELSQVVAPGLRADFPPPRTTGSHPTNLPPRLTPLIGRDGDIATLTELLQKADVSLVTLTGPGGTGKTRLALATGAELLPFFPDGVFFVDLSATTDASLVVAHIAQSLSLRETPGRSLKETLSDHLAAKEILLILDNLEQVIDAAPDIAGLLSSAPDLKVLATSREALRITGEKELSVAPLSLPEPSDPPEDVSASAAVRLFVTRAQDVLPGFILAPDDASTVAEVCRHLDGLPLAIELAAARVKVLSLAALNDRLAHGLKVLSSARRDSFARQYTLRAAIAWSYDLLSEDEQKLFRRLGVFVGGWSLEAAEAVCDQGHLDTDVLDGLASLVEKSLVVTDELRERFSMLETIRAFAVERLDDSKEAEDIRSKHAEFFWALAERAEPYLIGADQREWLDRLEADHDNLRSAVERCLAHDRKGAIAMTGALWRYWDIRGRWTEGRTLLERSLEDDDAYPAELTAKALHGLAWLAEARGDYKSAESHGRNALALYRRLDRSREVAGSLGLLGWSAYRQGDLARARALCEQAVEKARGAGDQWALGRALIGLGAVLSDDGDDSAAAAVYEETLTLQRRVGDTVAVATTLLNLGELAVHKGDTARAKVLLEESLENARRLADRYTICAALTNLALALLLEGDTTRSSSLSSESLVLAREVGSGYTVACVLEAMGCIAAHRKDVRRSGVLFGAADRLRQQIEAPVTPSEERFYESFLATVRRLPRHDQWREGWDEGHTMSVEDVLALVKVQ